MSKEKRKGTETYRRKNGLPAKAGKRHLTNPNHPGLRPIEQRLVMRKSA